MRKKKLTKQIHKGKTYEVKYSKFVLDMIEKGDCEIEVGKSDKRR